MKNVFKIAGVVMIAMMLQACGERVEVPAATIGKVMGREGYREDVIPTSRFVLTRAWFTVIVW